MLESTPEVLGDERIRAEVEAQARQGFATDAQIVESVTAVLVDEFPNDASFANRVWRVAPEVLAAVEAESRTWQVPTDNDRLDRAFAALERDGIVARQNFTCCQSCGHAEIGDEIEAARGPVSGYVFFHCQDTESAADGGGLFLAYGAVMPKCTPDVEWDRASKDVAGRVVTALRREGLDAHWDGNLSRRIQVPLVWRRRRSR